MGIGIHELLFLKYCKKNKNFETLSTLGRQEIYINKNDRFIKKTFTNYKDEKYADNLLIAELNLSKLKSYDVSNEDNPSEIKNFNFLINSPEKVDAFFDGGSLQHAFNIPVVLKNISNHVKVGGSIIHISSSNNLCGFGFYQFSPEFFINYYSNENGYINTKVFVASELPLKKKNDSNLTLIDYCKFFKADSFIVKPNTDNYHPHLIFEQNEIKLVTFNFEDDDVLKQSKIQWYDKINNKNYYLSFLDYFCKYGDL